MKMELHPKIKEKNIVAENEYAFYICETAQKFSEKTGIENNFDNWLEGIADERICRVISVSQVFLPIFLKTCNEIYKQIECVYSPKETLDEINEKLIAKELETLSPLQLELKAKDIEIEILRKKLVKKQVENKKN